ncbi:MAG: hypothetical protein OXC63_08355 [Aestuariivita sp.]|nr:hypothetical protein [Aestuariivita sp.]MCY4345403.1 hypothetical protein [Aestuariivita sp.]
MRSVTRPPGQLRRWQLALLASFGLGSGLTLGATALTVQAADSLIPSTQLETTIIAANPATAGEADAVQPAEVPALGADRTPMLAPMAPFTGNNEPEDIRDRLSAAIVAIENDIETLAQLSRWQTDLTRIARTDRAEALRQRRPLSECHGTVLEALCAELTGLFQDNQAERASAAPSGGSP